MLPRLSAIVVFSIIAATALPAAATTLYDSTETSPLTYGLMGGAGSTDNYTTTLWADDLHLAPSVANLGPTVTSMTIELANDLTDLSTSSTFSPTMEITFWNDNGGSGSEDGPGIWRETVTATPTFSGVTGASQATVTLTNLSAYNQPGDFLYALPSNFWMGVQFTSNLTDGSGTFYANRMGMLAYGTVTTGSSNPGFFVGTQNSNQGTFPPANNPSGSIVEAFGSGDLSLGYELTGVVPEPLSLASLAAAGLFVAVRRRRFPSRI